MDAPHPMNRTRTIVALALAVIAVSAVAGAGDPTPARETIAAARPGASLPVARVHRYRMSGAVRPLLFWVGRDHVGAGRITWRRDSTGRRAYELLIGSDPSLAPRKLNRWGYIAEEVQGQRGTVLGIISAAEEDSLEAVNRGVEGRRHRGVFKTIRATVGARASHAEVAILGTAEPLTYQDLEVALARMSENLRSVERRTTVRPAGARSGFLAAMDEIIHRSVECALESEEALDDVRSLTVPYVYGDGLHDLRVRSLELDAHRDVGERTFADVVHGKFATRSRATGQVKKFEVVFGTRPPLAGVPLWIRYQPRWWLKVDLTIEDET